MLPLPFQPFLRYTGTDTQRVHSPLQLVQRETTESNLVREGETGCCSECFLSSSLHKINVCLQGVAFAPTQHTLLPTSVLFGLD